MSMRTPAIRHVVFDIGNVLIHYDPDAAYRPLIPDAAERAWFLANVCTGDWNRAQDRGRPWAEGEALLIEKFPEHAAMIRAFRQNWNAMITHEYEDSVALLHGVIDAGHDVTMLTNFASDTFRDAVQRFDFLGRPRGATVSGDVGLLKPEAAIYERHTKDFALDPAATLFIDDSAANVKGAWDFGWQAVRFTGAEALREELERLGVV
jgi:2-haloacid dehalogenase